MCNITNIILDFKIYLEGQDPKQVIAKPWLAYALYAMVHDDTGYPIEYIEKVIELVVSSELSYNHFFN